MVSQKITIHKSKNPYLNSVFQDILFLKTIFISTSFLEQNYHIVKIGLKLNKPEF